MDAEQSITSISSSNCLKENIVPLAAEDHDHSSQYTSITEKNNDADKTCSSNNNQCIDCMKDVSKKYDHENWRITDENKNKVFNFKRQEDMEYSCILPASVNWYSSSILSCLDGFCAIGGKNAVFVADLRQDPPVFEWDLYPCTSINVKVTAVAFIATTDSGGETLPNHLAVGMDDGLIRVYDFKTKKLVKEHRKHLSKITAVSWSSVSKNVFWSADDKGILSRWSYKEHALEMWSPLPTSISSMKLCNNQPWIAIGYQTGNLIIGDTKKIEVLKTFKNHLDEITSLCWCPDIMSGDAPLLASSSKDRTIRTWDVNLEKPLATYSMPKRLPMQKTSESVSRVKSFHSILWVNKENIISGYPTGDLLCWNTTNGKYTVLKHIHNRVIFSLCNDALTQQFVSVSMDRQIVIWNSSSFQPKHTIPSFGGFVYSLSAASLDPHKIAVGVGDNVIRIWSTGDSKNRYNTTNIWQGIKSKVLVVKFHPNKEGVLGFGTEDGHIGCASTLSQKCDISHTYHKKSVYSLSWGPCCSVEDSKEIDFRANCLFSVGGEGGIYMHKLGSFNQDAVDIGKVIRTVNKVKTAPLRSDVCWRSDMRFVAIGNEDGSVHIFKASKLHHICSINAHKKIVNCLAWHHNYFSNTSEEAAENYGCWLASGSNEDDLFVYDLSKEIEDATTKDTPTVVITSNAFRHFVGHSGRITSVAWNPHKIGCLASGSYDGSVQIWDVIKSEPIANYRGHIGRVQCVLWSFHDPDVLHSGGEDFTLRRWKISHLAFKTPPSSVSGKKIKGNRNKRSKKIESVNVGVDNSLVCDDALTKATVEHVTASTEESLPLADVEVTVVLPNRSQLQKEVDKKKKKKKSFLKLASVADSKKKEERQKDCINLAKYHKAESEEKGSGGVKAPINIAEESSSNLGFYGTRKDVFRLVEAEIANHSEAGSYEQLTHLEVWRHNHGGLISKAHQEQELTETMVALSPIGGYDLWKATTLAFAEQLEAKRNFHQASLYYLAIGDVRKAISVFQRNGIFREALTLAKLQLCHEDPLINELYFQWAAKLTDELNYESAAECYIAAGSIDEAISVLARRGDASSMLTAIHVADTYNLKNRIFEYLPRCVDLLILEQKWRTCQELLKRYHSSTLLRVQVVVGEVLTEYLRDTDLFTSEFIVTNHDENRCYTKENPEIDALPAFLSKILYLLNMEFGISSDNVHTYVIFKQTMLDSLTCRKRSHRILQRQTFQHLTNCILAGIIHLLKQDLKSCFREWLNAFEFLVFTGNHSSLRRLFDVLFPNDLVGFQKLLQEHESRSLFADHMCFQNFLAFGYLDDMYTLWWRLSSKKKEGIIKPCILVAEHYSKQPTSSDLQEIHHLSGLITSYKSVFLSEKHMKLINSQKEVARLSEAILEKDIKKRLNEHRLVKAKGNEIETGSARETDSTGFEFSGETNLVSTVDSCLVKVGSKNTLIEEELFDSQDELVSQKEMLMKQIAETPDLIKDYAFPNPEESVPVLIALYHLVGDISVTMEDLSDWTARNCPNLLASHYLKNKL